MPFLTPALTRAQQMAEAALGIAKFEAEFTAGKDLSLDVSIRLALGIPDPAATGAKPQGPDAGDPAPLGKREAGVAALVADGLTDRQIGARLFISERTVDSHVRSILTKLGFSSRAQIAAWLASRPQ